MAGLFNKVPTDLDLNGPILSITTEPTGATGIGTTVGATGGASVSITGVATAVVGSSGTGGTGYLSYQWYEEGVGALSNGTYITGTASTGAVGSTSTLTLSNLVTPTDNDRKFYFEVDYVPSYTVGVQSVTESGYTTGNAWNEPITSGVATVTVSPLIDIVAQPTNRQIFLNTNTSVNVNADLTDSSFSDDLTYQWFLNGEEVSDGVKTTTTTTGSSTQGTVENYYTSPGSHTFPSTGITNTTIVVAGAGGGNGGLDGNGPGGSGGGGRQGKFILPNAGFLGKKVDFYIGQGGNDGTSGSAAGTRGTEGNLPNSNVGNGGHGGNAGATGWSGGGGGGGAASYVSDSDGIFLVAGGGGGGGGGSHNVGGQNVGDAPVFYPDPYTDINPLVSNGDTGTDVGGGDGGGGGGGGGGAPGGEGGQSGQDNSSGGRAGASGDSRYVEPKATLGHQWIGQSSVNGYVQIRYTGYTDTTVTTTTNTTISGSTSANLVIASDTVGVQTCMCKISSATASNSPIYSDTVNVVFNSTETNNNINVEGIGVGLTATLSTLNLANGDFTLQTTAGDVSTGQINNEWVLYSPDKDMDVEMDLYGGGSDDNTSGEGGYSRIRFTMTQNTEYVIAGLTTSINTPYLYRKGTLIACVGEGGKSDSRPIHARGGSGGGVNVAGADVANSGGGSGGVRVNTGELTLGGKFGSFYHGETPIIYPGDGAAGDGTGGFTIRCTKGIYWAQQGIGACDDIGTGRFRLPGGEEVTNTTTAITRGYKSGYNIIQTAGGGRGGFRGGNGARGGDGGQGANRAGGGGSGYTDGSVTVVDTRLGGSTEDSKVVLRLQS